MAANFNKNGVIDCTPIECSDTVNIMKNDIVVGENLLKNMNTFNLSGSDYPSYSTRTLGKIIVSSNTRGNAYQWCQNNMTPTYLDIISTTKTFSFSIDVKTIGFNPTMSISFGIDFRKSDHTNQVSGRFNLDPQYDGQWHRYSTIITANNAGQTWSLISTSFTNCNGVIIEYKNIKLEEGPIATPWCPALLDSMGPTPPTMINPIEANNFYEI